MPDITPNYNWIIPVKYKEDWYDDFVSLITQIDNSLKNEEVARKQVDETLLSLLGQSNVQRNYYVYVPLRNLTSGLATYNGTTWVERLNVASYTKEYFGLPSDKIVEVKYYVYYRARMSDNNTQGYIKSRLRQTTPSGQYVETPERVINSASWSHYSEVIDVPKTILTPDGLLDAMLFLKVDNGTINAYMDRTFLLFKMEL